MDILEEIKECEYCGEPIDKKDSIYQVMVYKKDGQQEFLKVCSKRCAEKARDMSYEIHHSMADWVKRQSIQKLR